jgi:hypothetical protein
MSRAGSPPRSVPVAAIVAVVTALVAGLAGTAVVAIQLAGGRSDTLNLVLVGIAGVGALCAVIGAAFRSRPEALVAGAIGLVVAVLLLGSGYAAFWIVFLWVVLGAPYLAGFGVALLLTEALLSGLRRGLGPASLVAAVLIVVIVAAGATYIGPRLIEGPCMGTSVEQGASSYLALVAQSNVRRDSLDAQFKAAGQNARQLVTAYHSAGVYDAEVTDLLRRLCFPTTVHSQVDAVVAATDARAQVDRRLEGDPLNPDLLAQLGSSQQAVTVAMGGLRRALGLPPPSEPSAAPSG